jgi:hypothetical protein
MFEAVNPTDPLRRWINSFDIAPRFVPHFDPAATGSEAGVLNPLEARDSMAGSTEKKPGSGYAKFTEQRNEKPGPTRLA